MKNVRFLRIQPPRVSQAKCILTPALHAWPFRGCILFSTTSTSAKLTRRQLSRYPVCTFRVSDSYSATPMGTWLGSEDSSVSGRKAHNQVSSSTSSSSDPRSSIGGAIKSVGAADVSNSTAVRLHRRDDNPNTLAASFSTYLRPESEPRGSSRVASAHVGGRPRAETDSQMRSSLPPTLSSDVVLDRRLLHKYEQVNQEIERIVRASQMDFAGAGDAASVKQVKHELRQAKKSSAQMIHAQKELLDKLEKQERGGFRRVFTINKAAKMAKLRSKLCEKLSESVVVDEQLLRLERQSTAISATALGTITRNGTAIVNVSNVHGAPGNTFMNTSSTVFSGHTGLEEAQTEFSNSECSGPMLTMRLSAGWEDAQEELVMLEREKEDILNNLFQTVDMPAALDLHARIASFSSEIKAVASVKKQADRVEELYRKALHLLRVALAAVVSPDYSGSIREFAMNSYPLAVEAGQLIEQACRVIQPEARRKYEAFALQLTHVRPPKFPQPVTDFARRSRTHYDPHSALSIEGMRNLHAAENVLILMQRLVIQKIEGIEKWQRKLMKDQEAAESAYAQMETKLQEQVTVVARSV